MIAVESYRQAIRNNAILVKVVIALSALSCSLGISFALLFPLKTTEYLLYEFSASGQTFYRIENAKDLISRKSALIRYAMREYVVDKESVNHLTESDKFIKVQNMSTNDVFAKFKQRYIDTTAKFFQKSKRKITIELDTPFAGNFNQQVHIVDFSATDTDEADVKTITYWQATIAYTFNEQKIRLDDLVHNPLGLEIFNYSINKRNAINELHN